MQLTPTCVRRRNSLNDIFGNKKESSTIGDAEAPTKAYTLLSIGMIYERGFFSRSDRVLPWTKEG